MAAGHSVSPAVWRQVWDEVTGRIAGWFARVETRRTACEMLRGLLSPIERKNGWWLAEHAGHVSPDRMQRLLRTAVWDDVRVRALDPDGQRRCQERRCDSGDGHDSPAYGRYSPVPARAKLAHRQPDGKGDRQRNQEQDPVRAAGGDGQDA